LGKEKVLKDERKDEDENKEFVVMQGGNGSLGKRKKTV
jgi:hypothetical protein